LSSVYGNMARGIVALVFQCEAVSGQPGPTQEAVEVRFLTPSEISKRMDDAYACRLLDALQPGVAIRSHDGVVLIG
jgi:8-oxo-dGTP diphosphatase